MATKSTDEYLQNTNCCVDKSKLKQIRKEKKMSLDDIAETTGLSRGLIWKMESYNFGIQLCHFLKVAKALGVETESLLINDNTTIND